MHSHLSASIHFRRDINGLRAWAVMAVLFFHFPLIGLQGGFAGVDVFFVISGYLMTAIIVGGYEKGNFSIFKFYKSRARRILPALLFMLSIMFILGWFWLPTNDYKELSKQSVYSLAFLSNIDYWHSYGYFDSLSQEKWLLHTWSLAVEAQFYILYPIFISLIWNYWKNIKAIKIGVLVLLSASLILSLIITQKAPVAAFYFLPTRVWELASGGVVYLIVKQGTAPKKLKRNGLYLGWFLVIGSFFLFSDQLAWPGYWAILTVFGVNLIILGQPENCRFTDSNIAQWLGERSFSLYLWHWPLVVLLFFLGEQDNWLLTIVFLIASIALADFSYNFIESPIKTRKNPFTKTKFIFFIYVMIMIFSLISTIFFTRNDSESIEIKNKIQTIASDKNYKARKCLPNDDGLHYPICIFGEGEVKAIMIGDSHAQTLIHALSVVTEKQGGSVRYFGVGGCPTILNYKSIDVRFENKKCQNFLKSTFKSLSEYETNIPVIIVNRSSKYIIGTSAKPITDKSIINENLKKMSDTLLYLSENRNVYFLKPIPEMNKNPLLTYKRNLTLSKKDIVRIDLNEYNSRHKLVLNLLNDLETNSSIKTIDSTEVLCENSFCYGLKATPRYYDDNHLTQTTGDSFIESFEKILTK